MLPTRSRAQGLSHPRAAARRKGRLFLTAMLVVSMLAVPGFSGKSDRKWLMGYYVVFLADRYPVDVVSWQSLTHIAVGAALPKSSGRLDTSFYMSGDKGPEWAKDVVRAAHQHNVKAVLMIGGAETAEDFRDAVRPERRAVFIDSILDSVAEYGFDGVDIDWEPMLEKDIAAITALADDLRARRSGLLLTVPIGSVNINRLSDVPRSISSLAGSFDQINLMTYGMHGAGWRDWKSWHPGALHGEGESTPMSVDSTVNTYIGAGLPPHKLGLGIGFYGACYRGITGPSQYSEAMEVVADDNKMSYANVMNDYYVEDIAAWDDRSQTPYLSSEKPIGPLRCNYVPYEDKRSVQLKAQYAVNRGLGGAIVWNINQGYRRAMSDGSREDLLPVIAASLIPR